MKWDIVYNITEFNVQVRSFKLLACRYRRWRVSGISPVIRMKWKINEWKNKCQSVTISMNPHVLEKLLVLKRKCGEVVWVWNGKSIPPCPYLTTNDLMDKKYFSESLIGFRIYWSAESDSSMQPRKDSPLLTAKPSGHWHVESIGAGLNWGCQLQMR